MSGMTKGERDNLARLARQRSKLAKEQIKERQKVLQADIEDQLAAQHRADEEIWADITRQAKAEVARADAKVAEICRSWGIPDEMRPRLVLNWYNRGSSASGERRGELRRLAHARIEAAGQTAKTTIDHKLLEVETELVREGLESDRALAYLEAMPSADALMPSVDIGELDGKPERKPWTAPPELAGGLLTPSSGRAREERRKAVARALAANPDGSDREIARMAGVDHKTVGKARSEGGELPGEDGEFPTDGEPGS